ncbi:MAG: hypothetical protein CMJ58_00390 [Planctomycetaceae bacterium]|nr:hypothetical protein [Planctomycetaceae bacterium]
MKLANDHRRADSRQARVRRVWWPQYVALQAWTLVDALWRAWRRPATAKSPRDQIPYGSNPYTAACVAANFQRLNEYRVSRGLRPVRFNRQLAAAAAFHGRRMVELRQFEHILSDGVELDERLDRHGYAYGAYAENLAVYIGPRRPAASLGRQWLDDWIASPGHHKNLVGDYEEVGIAVVVAGDVYFGIQNFGTPRSRLASRWRSPAAAAGAAHRAARNHR